MEHIRDFNAEVQQVDIEYPDGCWERVEYPEFFGWRFNQIFGNSKEFLIITPDMMDEYFKELEDPTQTRCPRCLSVNVNVGYPYIECQHCGYNEPLIDFPISEYTHLAFLQEVKR